MKKLSFYWCLNVKRALRSSNQLLCPGDQHERDGGEQEMMLQKLFQEAKIKSDQHNVLTSTIQIYTNLIYSYIKNTYHHKDAGERMLDSSFNFTERSLAFV